MAGIKLRPVRADDKNNLLDWANDPETVNSRFNSRLITIEEHENWFEKSLRDTNRLIYIAEDESGKKIGVVRLDRLNELVAEYDINVAPAMRGKGYGPAMIAKATEIYEPEKRALLFIARIKKTNLGSKAAFLKAGCLPMFTYCDREHGEVEVLGMVRP